jgi:hypothetical protein
VIKWTKQDERFLIDNTNINTAVLARLMGRTHTSVYDRFRDLKLKSTFRSMGILPPKISYNTSEMKYSFRPKVNGIVKNTCKSHSLIECLDNLDSYNQAVRMGCVEGDLL